MNNIFTYDLHEDIKETKQKLSPNPKRPKKKKLKQINKHKKQKNPRNKKI